MHPAYSVILFTTASGAGYGLLAWLALLTISGAIPPDRWIGIVGLGAGLALVTAGLLSSTAHLGRPERAWRAFSQWRSSWLSREGVAAVATYVPTAIFAIGWVFYGATTGLWALAGLMAAALALVTVACTGMIYQSLPPIPAWSLSIVTPIYVILALASGSALALLILRVFGYTPPFMPVAVAILLTIAVLMKRRYWRTVDDLASARTSAEGPTGLGRFGTVRVLEPPHTQPNFVMREMGYQVGRRHAVKLRSLAADLGMVVPACAALLSVAVGPRGALLLTMVAVICLAFGLIVERWLFFAEARHLANEFYAPRQFASS